MNLATQNVSTPRSTTHIHMCVDISGVLRWDDGMLRKLFSEEGGRPPSGKYVRDWLKLQLAQGKKVLPMGAPCEGFSYQTGCPGHPEKAPSVSNGS